MNWEQRLRDMVIAGGALAAGACADPAKDAAAGYVGSSYCCNGSLDPCCTCAGPDAEQDPDACVQKIGCEAEGGTWGIDRVQGPCSFPSEAAPDAVGRSNDSTSHDSAPYDSASDGGAESDGHD
jgi:hypothetical protein